MPQAPNGEFRTVIEISKEDDGGALQATLYSIDQLGMGLKTSAVTLQGSNLKMSFAGMGATYEGKVSGDSITGTMTRGMPLLLNLTRASNQTAWTIPEPPARLKPMPADANPAFEVATIKPSGPEGQGKGSG